MPVIGYTVFKINDIDFNNFEKVKQYLSRQLEAYHCIYAEYTVLDHLGEESSKEGGPKNFELSILKKLLKLSDSINKFIELLFENGEIGDNNDDQLELEFTYKKSVGEAEIQL